MKKKMDDKDSIFMKDDKTFKCVWEKINSSNHT